MPVIEQLHELIDARRFAHGVQTLGSIILTASPLVVAVLTTIRAAGDRVQWR